MRRAALVLAALAFTGCESNQERSATLERAARQQPREARERAALVQRAVTITHRSTKVDVLSTAIVSSSEGTAAVVSMRNVSSTPLLEVPVRITVRDAHGATVYRNAIAGLSATLLSLALLPAHTTVNWIDDQVQASDTPASVSAEVGEGTTATGALPALSVTGAHLSEGAEAEGNLVNHSSVAQQEVVVDGVARRGGRIVAAGRAVLPYVPAASTTPFQIFFVGDPAGAQLEFSAPPTSSG